MNLMPRWGWLQSMTGTATPHDTTDAADMGTAFGLDASFQDPPDGARDNTPSTTRQVSPLTGLPRN